MSGTQDERTRAANRDFFTHEHEWYTESVASMTTYRHISEAINAEIAGLGVMLDVGNGGTFPYDNELVDKIIAVDLYLADLPADHFPSNVSPRNGDALALAEEPHTYDGVLMSMLFHHLTGPSPAAVMDNAACVLDEVRRVLKPGGRLVVVESCVPPWFYAVERGLYPALRRVGGTKLLRHPATLQLTAPSLVELIGARFTSLRWRRIPVGALLMQFGWRWPSALTPARPYCFVATKKH